MLKQEASYQHLLLVVMRIRIMHDGNGTIIIILILRTILHSSQPVRHATGHCYSLDPEGGGPCLTSIMILGHDPSLSMELVWATVWYNVVPI